MMGTFVDFSFGTVYEIEGFSSPCVMVIKRAGIEHAAWVTFLGGDLAVGFPVKMSTMYFRRKIA